ncbi:MAG: pyridoxamine 5'-phosphate oxidase family protein [candidate division Zixibacteria bacterium]|nr:pyridoxamine 5'-phosphate oxidase family protein [candidate division Zixibacteria bacterium]
MARYHMHNRDKEIKDQSVLKEILKQGKYAVVSMCRGKEPYLVALNYGYDKDKNALYFHCALKGLKLDFIKHNPEVCGTVIEDGGYVKGDCKQVYRSVVFWGKMFNIEGMKEKKRGIGVLLNHLEGGQEKYKKGLQSDDAYKKVGILRLDINEITGKQGD